MSKITAAVCMRVAGLLAGSLPCGWPTSCAVTPLMSLLDLSRAQPETQASLAGLLKATADITSLLQQEHTERLAGVGLAPTSEELQYGIPQALWK